MHALEFVTSDNLNVGFLVIVFVEEGAVACTGDSASFHHGADTAIKNVLVLSRDLGSKDRRGALAAGYLELQTFIADGYIGCCVELGERGGADGICADGQVILWKGCQGGEVKSLGVGKAAGAVYCPHTSVFVGGQRASGFRRSV